MPDNVISSTECARILSQVTRGWCGVGNDPAAVLENARFNLASTIFAAGGRGFPPADVTTEISQECAEAVIKAAADPHGADPPANVVFWKPDPGNTGEIAKDVGLKWPFSDAAQRSNMSGDLLEPGGDVPKRLFFFSAVPGDRLKLDFDDEPGLWPRGRKSSGGDIPPPQKLPIVRPRSRVAHLLLGASLLSAVIALTAASTWNPHDAPVLIQQPLVWTTSLIGGDYRLALSLLCMMVALALSTASAGVAMNGQLFGVMIDGRNRLSLSSLQQVSWTVLLLSGIVVIAWHNASSNGLVLFPSMANELWAALGINLLATPLASSAILSLKAGNAQKDADAIEDGGANDPPSPDTRRLVTAAPLDSNGSPSEASLLDLVTGETLGTGDTIDISRLQQVIISGFLLAVYFHALLSTLEDSKATISKMPDVSGVGNNTFIGLLAFSHASYLVFKARAKPAKSSTADAS